MSLINFFNTLMALDCRRRGRLASHAACRLKGVMSPEAGISKNYCAKKSGLPEVELRFCLWIILFKYGTGRGLGSASGERT